MIQVVHEHSVDLSVLPEKANILDLGCRGFQFAFHFSKLGHNVTTVDPDPSVLNDNVLEYTFNPRFMYSHYYSHYRVAITGVNGHGVLQRNTNDPQATTVRQSNGTVQMHMSQENNVNTYTLAGFSSRVYVKFWDLIKMDIEGSEYEVIMSLTEAPAIQLSIEFHLHTGIYGDTQIKEMEDKLLSLGYFPTKHDKTSQHGAGFNYWDSLFVLQSHRKEYSEPTNY